MWWQDKMSLMVIRRAPVTSLLPMRCEDDLRSTGSQGLCIRLIPVNYKPLEVRSHTRLAGLHRASTRHSGWHILPLKKICWVNGCFSCRQQWLNRERWGFPDGSFGKESACNAGDPSSIPEWGRSAGGGISYPLQYSWASLVAQLVKNPPAMRETCVRSLGWEDPLEKGKAYPLQNSGLENSMDCIMHRVAKSQTLTERLSHGSNVLYLLSVANQLQSNATQQGQFSALEGKKVTWAAFLSSTTGWTGPHTQAIITLQQGGNSSFILAVFKILQVHAVFKTLQEWCTMIILQFSKWYKNLWRASVTNKCISSSRWFTANTVLNSLPHKHCALKNKEKTNSKPTHKNKQHQPPEEKAQHDLKRDYGGEVMSHFLWHSHFPALCHEAILLLSFEE